MSLTITTVALAHEQDIVSARRRARQIAGLLKFNEQERTRIGTAVSEMARNAFAYGRGGKVEFKLDMGDTPALVIDISDNGPGIANVGKILSGQYESSTGMGLGIVGARRLMDDFEIVSGTGKGTRVTLRKNLTPGTAVTSKELAVLVDQLAQEPQDIYDEIRHQNQELLDMLDRLRQREEDLSRMNRELEDTNRGVVALYAELDQRAEQLRQADQTKSRFLSHISHEFRTPLNAIIGLTRLLLKRDAVTASPEVAREVTFIQKTTLSLTEMVDDLLDLSKAESGKLTVQVAEFEVSALFGTLRALLKPLAANSAVELIFEEPASMPAMNSDESKISQILRNFVSNALKFTERGNVTVRARFRAKEDSIAFSVEDTGIGIAPEHQGKIFEEFSQIENPLQKKAKGTGLGLALCKKMTELLGGVVRVESKLGEGSTFTAVIPRRYSEVRESQAAERRRRVVLIDDEDVPRYLMNQLLGETYEVLEASTGAEGIGQARRFRPDIIILDLNMPLMNGFEVLDRLKGLEETKSIPVVVVTGQKLDGVVREQLAQKTAAVLPKDVLAGAEALAIDFGPPLSISPRFAGSSRR